MSYLERIQAFPEQAAVVSALEHKRVLVVEALAGAGKTTTLLACAEAAHRARKRTLYLAFNSKIVQETKERGREWMECRTAHGLALSRVADNVRAKFRATEGQFLKDRERIRELDIPEFLYCPEIGEPDGREVRELFDRQTQRKRKRIPDTHPWQYIPAGEVLETIDHAYTAFVKSAAFTLERTAIIESMQRSLAWPYGEMGYAQSPTLIDFVFQRCRRYWEATIDVSSTRFPLGHDIYLKLWQLERPVLDYDLILFDEAQDADPVMVDIIARQTCQVLWCGDSQQQIYSWRGAVNTLKQVVADQRLSITMTQRFGPPLDRLANAFLIPLGGLRVQPNPTLQSGYRRESGPTGRDPRAPVQLELFRTNVALLQRFLDLSETNEHRLQILADLRKFRELLEGLMELFHERPPQLPWLLRFDGFEELVDFVNALRLRLKRNRKAQAPSWFPDTVNILRCQLPEQSEQFVVPPREIRECPAWERLHQAIIDAEALRDEADITLATGHKAKGLTRDTVRVHADFLQHSLYGEPKTVADAVAYAQPHVREGGAEDNDWLEHQRLCYVAVTRARRLVLHPFQIMDLPEAEGLRLDADSAKAQVSMATTVAAPLADGAAPWIATLKAALEGKGLAWSAPVAKPYRYTLMATFADLRQLRIDVIVNKHGRPTDVQFYQEKEESLRSEVERALGLSKHASNEQGRHEAFLARLTDQLRPLGVEVQLEADLTLYQSRYRFTRGAECCTGLLYFNQSGRFTKCDPKPVSGSEPLFRLVGEQLPSLRGS